MLVFVRGRVTEHSIGPVTDINMSISASLVNTLCVCVAEMGTDREQH